MSLLSALQFSFNMNSNFFITSASLFFRNILYYSTYAFSVGIPTEMMVIKAVTITLSSLDTRAIFLVLVLAPSFFLSETDGVRPTLHGPDSPSGDTQDYFLLYATVF